VSCAITEQVRRATEEDLSLVSPELQQLIKLQDIDVKIFELNDRLAAIPGERESLEAQFRQQTADHLALEESLATARTEHGRIENELADLERAHDKFKSDLMRVHNTKEYQTVLREIDATKKTISALETEALQYMEKIEGYEKDLAERAPEYANRRAEVDETLVGFDAEVARIHAEIDELRASRDAIAGSVRAQYLAIYNRIAQTRRGRAMSEVRADGSKGRCSACNLGLRPQVFSDVRRGDTLIVCDSCSRILFYRPEQAPVEANVS
jgi:predicted  nucleic acid-binding Zn-ribbon protein